jgi:hypothetical protein
MSYKQYLWQTLHESFAHDADLWRGSKTPHKVGEVMRPRTDRKPKDTPKNIDAEVNKRLETAGKPRRDRVLFLTAFKSDAYAYGTPWKVEVMMPDLKNPTVWSNRHVKDFYSDIDMEIDVSGKKTRVEVLEILGGDVSSTDRTDDVSKAIKAAQKAWPEKIEAGPDIQNNQKAADLINKDVDSTINKFIDAYVSLMQEYEVTSVPAEAELLSPYPLKIIGDTRAY